MKREDVEALLRVATGGGGQEASAVLRMQDLAALCRRWLAVEDAPAADITSATYDRIDGRAVVRMLADHGSASLVGQRVRIIPDDSGRRDG